MKKIIQALLIILLAGYFTSCENFLDINDDPNNPSEAAIVDLLPSGQIGTVFGISNMLNRVAEDAVQHLVVQRFDGWAVEPADVSNAWRFSLYAGGLADFADVIRKATETEDWHYVGVSKLMMAYAYSVMVDLWDDIPYEQALQPMEFSAPVFDEAAGIYDNLFNLIDEGLADLDKSNEVSMAGLDLIYNGDVASWKRMGNTLKLKMYNQIRLVDEARARAGIESLVAAEAASPGTVLISSGSQDFNFYYFNQASPDNRHPNFQNDYKVKSEAWISNYFFNMMFSNSDPRIPYYFYHQSGDFEGRDYGDPASIGDDQDTRTVPGLYPYGGKFDDGSSEVVSGSSAGGDGAYRMITNVMRLFIEAEAALTMGATVSDQAENLFEEAMLAAFDEVNSLGAPVIADGAITTYVNNRLAAFAAASTTEEKLDLLMEEKYIANFGNGIEAYNDYRRTGYPDIPAPIETNELELRRFPYPDDELRTNPESPDQPEKNQPVFWDNN